MGKIAIEWAGDDFDFSGRGGEFVEFCLSGVGGVVIDGNNFGDVGTFAQPTKVSFDFFGVVVGEEEEGEVNMLIHV